MSKRWSCQPLEAPPPRMDLRRAEDVRAGLGRMRPLGAEPVCITLPAPGYPAMRLSRKEA